MEIDWRRYQVTTLDHDLFIYVISAKPLRQSSTGWPSLGGPSSVLSSVLQVTTPVQLLIGFQRGAIAQQRSVGTFHMQRQLPPRAVEFGLSGYLACSVILVGGTCASGPYSNGDVLKQHQHRCATGVCMYGKGHP
jgi:hypothetical protein